MILTPFFRLRKRVGFPLVPSKPFALLTNISGIAQPWPGMLFSMQQERTLIQTQEF